MSNGAILILTFFIGTIILISGFIYYWKNYKKQAAAYPELSQRFTQLSTSTNYGEIIEVGTALIHNKHLKQNDLTLIHETAKKLEQWHPDFTLLKLLAFNKQLHYDRPLQTGFD